MSDPENVAAPVILFVDDEATAVKYFQRAIGSLAPVATASSVEEGKRVLDAHAGTIRVLVSDQRMPGAYGNELLEFAKVHYPDIVRILTTAYSEIEHMVEAVNQGQIYRYLQKPWEITALRMEMKQALDMANLRSEHTQLLREKIMVRRHQLLANRIGNAYAICAGVGQGPAFESCMRAADAAGIAVPELDWMKMDYADLIGTEAFRDGAFHMAVVRALAGIEAGGAGQDKLAALASVLGGKARPGPAGSLVLERKIVVEYFENPTGESISAEHAGWFAGLLWLSRHGASVQIEAEGDVVRCTLAGPAEAVTESRLAAWVDNFM